MRFPKYGHYAFDLSGNVLEIFATGAWNLQTAEMFAVEMHELVDSFKGQQWAALLDGRRWVLSTPECQSCLKEAINVNIAKGLRCSAYVLDVGMVKRAHLERMHPANDKNFTFEGYEREYFTSYFDALKWLNNKGYSPL